ncbi:CRPV-182 [Crowpox virus]|nr:CRPV-182 [Crowpox virus]
MESIHELCFDTEERLVAIYKGVSPLLSTVFILALLLISVSMSLIFLFFFYSIM